MDRLNRNDLSLDDQFLLESKVLPTWKRWMLDYSFGSSLFAHGIDGVTKWGAENDPDINSRYRDYQRDQQVRGAS